MTFDYLERVVVEGQLEVTNIGQCIIRANTDLAHEYYLIIKTELGWSECLEYGPCTPDLQLLPESYQIRYNRFEYNQQKLMRTIDKFLNNPKRRITQAQVVELDDVHEFLVNPIDKVFPKEE